MGTRTMEKCRMDHQASVKRVYVLSVITKDSDGAKQVKMAYVFVDLTGKELCTWQRLP